MGAKGGTPATTTTQTSGQQTFQPPGFVTGAGQQAIGGAEAAAAQPFQMPVAPIAPFSPFQQQAFGATQAAMGMAQPYFGLGSAYLAGSAAPVTGADVSGYYNPMAANVTAQMQNIFGQQMRETTGQATQQAGGVGADRIAVAQANLANQQGLAAGQTYSQLYQQALQAAEQQKQMMAGAGFGFGQFGPAAQGAQLQSIQAMLGAGGYQQQLAQAYLNSLYQNRLAQLGYPFQVPQYLAGITAGVGPAMGGRTSGTQTSVAQATPAQPSALAQGIGLGTAALGAWGGMGFPGLSGAPMSLGTIGGTNPMGGGSAGAIYRHGGKVIDLDKSEYADGGATDSTYGKLADREYMQELGRLLPAAEAGNPIAVEVAGDVGGALPKFASGGFSAKPVNLAGVTNIGSLPGGISTPPPGAAAGITDPSGILSSIYGPDYAQSFANQYSQWFTPPPASTPPAPMGASPAPTMTGRQRAAMMGYQSPSAWQFMSMFGQPYTPLLGQQPQPFQAGGAAPPDGQEMVPGITPPMSGGTLPGTGAPQSGGMAPVPYIPMPSGTSGKSGPFGTYLPLSPAQISSTGGGGSSTASSIGTALGVAAKVLPMLAAMRQGGQVSEGGGVDIQHSYQGFQEGGDIPAALADSPSSVGIDLSPALDYVKRQWASTAPDAPPMEAHAAPGTTPAVAGLGQPAAPPTATQAATPMGAALPMPRSRPAPSGADIPSLPSEGIPGTVTAGWQEAGMNPIGIAGIHMNLPDESGYNPSLRHPDQPHWSGEARNAHGIYQEGGQEWLNYQNWLKDKGKSPSQWEDPKLQTEFGAWNLKTNYPKVWDQMMNAKTPGEAAVAYMRGYLKPASQYADARSAKYLGGSGDISGAGAGAGPMGATAADFQTPSSLVPYPDALKQDVGQRLARSPWAALVAAGATMATTPGPIGSVIGAGIKSGMGELEGQRKSLQSEEALNMKEQQLWSQYQTHLKEYQALQEYREGGLDIRRQSLNLRRERLSGVPANVISSIANKVYSDPVWQVRTADEQEAEIDRRVSALRGRSGAAPTEPAAAPAAAKGPPGSESNPIPYTPGMKRVKGQVYSVPGSDLPQRWTRETEQ